MPAWGVGVEFFWDVASPRSAKTAVAELLLREGGRVSGGSQLICGRAGRRRRWRLRAWTRTDMSLPLPALTAARRTHTRRLVQSVLGECCLLYTSDAADE